MRCDFIKEYEKLLSSKLDVKIIYADFNNSNWVDKVIKSMRQLYPTYF
ncbi:MAG: hypothetical protein ACTSYR_01945 [Candidatus Odinarchaeia archaeon]